MAKQLFNLFEEDTATGIGRFGAALGGNLGQFDRDQSSSQQQREQQQESARLKAIRTFSGAGSLFHQGDIEGSFMMLSQGDSNAQKMAQEMQAAAGNPQAMQEISDDFDNFNARAIAAGDLQGPKQVSELEQQETRYKKLQADQLAADLNGGSKPKEADVQNQVNTLRKDITTAGKAFELVKAANNRITKTGNKGTPASDISLVFNFMKMNDPGSTVREGEFATAQNAEGVPGRVVNLYNQMLDGTRLNPAQRKDFIQQSNGLFLSQRDSFDSQIENTLQQADQDSIGRERVLGKKRLGDFNDRAKARASGSISDAGVGGSDIPSQDLGSLSLDELIKLRQQVQ